MELAKNGSGVVCDQHGIFECKNNVFLFAPDKHFGDHWDTVIDDAVPEVKIEQAKSFLKPLFKHLGDTPDNTQMILDAGCGNGAHLTAIAQQYDTLNLVGLDISPEAFEGFSQILRNRVWTVQADMQAPPFTRDGFDAIIAFGSLAYMPSPGAALLSLARLLKPGGTLGIWIAPPQPGLAGALLRGVRRLCQLTGRIGTKMMTNALVPFLGLMPTKSGIHLRNATWKQCREVIQVNITPETLHFPTKTDMKTMLKDSGLEVLLEVENEPYTYWLHKPLTAERKDMAS